MRPSITLTAVFLSLANFVLTLNVPNDVGHFIFPGHGPLPDHKKLVAKRDSGALVLPAENIQSDILYNMKNPRELFYFFQINSAVNFKKVLKTNIYPLITTADIALGPAANVPSVLLNVAFTSTGLKTLGVPDNLNDPLFSAGQWTDAAALGDTTNNWETGYRGTTTHGVFLIAGKTDDGVVNMINQLNTWLGTTISYRNQLNCSARPGANMGHEHFGFLDGFIQPAVDGFSTTVLPGQTLVPAGKMITGYAGDLTPRPAWAYNGSFLAFRKLQQKVPEWNNYMLANAIQNPQRTLTPQQGADYLAARVFGRWKSGTPIDLAPIVDDPSIGPDPQRNNNFDYSHAGEDITKDQSKCPFSAHIRKMVPRADQGNANVENLLLRSGLPYGPEMTASEISTGKTVLDRGMAFAAYQTSIKNGFRFQQISMGNNAQFPYGKNDTTPGQDMVIGQANSAIRTTSGLDPNNFQRDLTAAEFVVSRGGEYFFSPSKSALLNTIAA